MRCSGCRPYYLVLHQVFIDIGFHLRSVPQRRHAANHKAGRCLNQFCVRLSHFPPASPTTPSCTLLAPLTSANIGLPGGSSTKIGRLHNLPNLTIAGLCCFHRRTRAVRQLHHSLLHPASYNALCTFSACGCIFPHPYSYITHHTIRITSPATPSPPPAPVAAVPLGSAANRYIHPRYGRHLQSSPPASALDILG